MWKIVSLSQIFPNADLRLLKQCVSVRDKLLQKQYDKHKVCLAIIIYLIKAYGIKTNLHVWLVSSFSRLERQHTLIPPKRYTLI